MKAVKELTVKVIYRVGMGEVEMPQKIYNQIVESVKNGDKIQLYNTFKYSEAANWLSDNIRESDCVEWDVEIEDIS